MIQATSLRPSASRVKRPFHFLKSMIKPESVYFFTLHKCASAFYSRYVLKNALGLRQVDPGKVQNQSGDLSRVQFHRRGHVYGPLRLSTGGDDEMGRYIIGPATAPEFLRQCKAILLIRDPRDIVVSAYYSFAFSHRLSPNEKIRARQEKNRKFYQSHDIDDLVPQVAHSWQKTFQKVEHVVENAPRCVLLKYEDMIDDWGAFRDGLCRHLTFEEATLREIYSQTRPQEKEDISAHHRSGKTGGFREKLKPETIRELNAIFAATLDRFGYER